MIIYNLQNEKSSSTPCHSVQKTSLDSYGLRSMSMNFFLNVQVLGEWIFSGGIQIFHLRSFIKISSFVF